MLNGSNVISLQISTADIMQQIVWIESSSIRTVRTFVPEPGIPGILGVRVTTLASSIIAVTNYRSLAFHLFFPHPSYTSQLPTQLQCEVSMRISENSTQ